MLGIHWEHNGNNKLKKPKNLPPPSPTILKKQYKVKTMCCWELHLGNLGNIVGHIVNNKIPKIQDPFITIPKKTHELLKCMLDHLIG
jgi:hypothetical protein